MTIFKSNKERIDQFNDHIKEKYKDRDVILSSEIIKDMKEWGLLLDPVGDMSYTAYSLLYF